MAYYYTDEVVDHLYNVLTPNLATWGLNGIYKWDNDLTPQSPALLIVGLPREREWSGSHQYTIRFNIIMFIVNGNMLISKSDRRSALEHTSDQIVAFLDIDRNLGGNIVQGWVTRDSGGDLTVKQGNIWLAHRIDWLGEQRQVVNT